MQDLKEREDLDDASLKYISSVLELLPKIRFPQQPTGSGLAPDDLPPPDGRWIMRLFDRVKA
ncbi:hypothetical protein C8A03DRAFT_39203 [Achaetomium macrosporum]|uniref:Uncharacterized protein n=1 Tax=Achaetomium macrosporum TaxID=79813 RepID=A0AAN7C0N6_9PEZI|nr:hypothetical protein C8A03DRAFT_39203 [Achaetomium macrosporum]